MLVEEWSVRGKMLRCIHALCVFIGTVLLKQSEREKTVVEYANEEVTRSNERIMNFVRCFFCIY